MGNFIRNFGGKIGWMKVVVCIFLGFNLNAQTTIYSENFDDASHAGKGKNQLSAVDVSGVNWNITLAGNAATGFSTNDYFYVNNGKFEAKGSFGATTKLSTTNVAIWYANSGNPIDISTYGRVSISVDLGIVASYADGLLAQVSSDGTNWVDFGYNSNSATTSTYQISNIIGQNLYLRVLVWTVSGSSSSFIDNIIITGYPGYLKQTLSSGSGSWTVPSGVTSVDIYAWGGGGGGGATTGTTKGGSSGGGGALAYLTNLSLSGITTCYYSVGTGGAGATANTSNTGGGGTDSWFNKTSNAAPSSSSDGVLAKAGTGGATNGGTKGTGGVGTGSSIGSVLNSGGDGNTGGSYSGAGGGASGSFFGSKQLNVSNLNGTIGNAGGDVDVSGGVCGGSDFGGDGGVGESSSGNGGNGITPGGGGGGSNDATTSAGGSGANGMIILVYLSPPTITTSASFSTFSACSGSNSTSQSFTVSGVNMSAGILVNPPVGYEVSTTSDFSSNIGTNGTGITVGSSGTIASTTIYVRTTTAASNGASGNITCTSTGATQKDIATGSATISPTSVGGSIAGSATVCTGTNSTGLTLSGHTGTITKWQSSTVSDFSSAVTDIVNATTTQTATNLTATTYYRAVITSGSCAATNSATATVTVSPTSVGGSIAGSATVCTGTNSTVLTLSGHTGSITKWQYSTASDFSAGLTDVANTTASLTATDLTSTTYYRAVVTNGVCAAANSASATVTVETQSPTTSAAGSDITLPTCGTPSIVLGANTPSVGTGVWSITSGPNTNTNQLSSTSSASATFTPAGGAGTYVLRWTISNSCGSNFDEVSITVSGSSYSGILKVGVSGGHFTSLNDAITKLNSCGYTGNIILELQSNYDGTSTTEGASNPMITFPSTFASVASSSIRTITIQPASGVNSKTITSSSTTGTILLNGADYIYFNGSPAGTPGSGATMSKTNNLTISNSSTSGYVFKFINDATYNKIEYCNVSGVNTAANNGSIWFSTGAASGTGNEYNQINYCEIYDGATKPTNAIYSLGDATVNNDITINGNYIYNYFSSSTSHSGLLLSDYNTKWIITNNKFYQTSAIDIGAAVTHRVIDIEYTLSAGNDFTITGNTIGGNQSNNSGTYDFTGHATASNSFTAIYLKVGTSTASTIHSNTIKNIKLTDVRQTATTSVEGMFNGIAILAGSANIGASGNKNVIGSNSSTSSISFNCVAADARIFGIYCNSTGTVNISYNDIGGIGTTDQAITTATQLYGIYNHSAGTITIANNTIDSLRCGGASTTSAAHLLYGIFNRGATAIDISNNTISKCIVYSTGAAKLYGIYNETGATGAKIESNSLTNLRLGTTVTNNASANVTVIYNEAAPSISISSNTISAITCKNGYFRGIQDNVAATGTHTISSNTIGSSTSNDISIASTTTTVSMGINAASTGIYIISSNTIQNISQSGDAAKDLYGIQIGSTGTYTVSENTIDKLYNNISTSPHRSSVMGVNMAGIPNASSVIKKNKITNFKNLNPNGGYIYGIIGLTATSLNAYNNFFECDNEGSSNNNALSIYGIYGDYITSLVAYHNTIYISGHTTVNSMDGYSFCIRQGATPNVKNNILINTRTDGGSTASQGITYGTFSDATYDYNYYYVKDATLTSGGGTSSRYHRDGTNTLITINSDGSLTSSGYTTVGTGTNLGATVSDDIRGSTREEYIKGCYEGVGMIYYSRYADDNTNANTLTNWTTKRDGSGSTPSNFTSESKFKIQTGHKYQVTSTWSGHASSIIYVESGGALDVNAQTLSTWSNFDLAGTGVSSSGALLSTSASPTSASLPITLSANATVTSSGTGNLTLTGNITTAGYTLTVNGDNNTTISTGVISGSGIVSKSGSGILTLSGTNTHTGGTTVSAGTLAIGNDSGLGSGTLTISGGSLDASGADRTIINPVIIYNDFIFTGSNNLTQNTGSVGLTGTSVITVNNNNLTINGVISNSGNGTVTVTSTGNGTWTCPAGVTSATVHCWGGGGGGAYALVNGGTAGGGGGAYVRSTLTVSAGQVYNYTVGTGGTKGIGSSSTAATAGGDSYFGNTSAGSSAGASNIAKGGGAGISNTAGSGGTSAASTVSGSSTQKYSGGNGYTGGYTGGSPDNDCTSAQTGGTGGGGAGSGSNGSGPANTSTQSSCALTGGSGTYPGGSGGSGGLDGNGSDGSQPGGGGGGSDGGSNVNGGAGGAGQIIIIYTPSDKSITKSGAGILTLGGTNTFSNGVTLNAGTLNINNAAALGATTGTFTINGGTINNTSGSSITMNNYPMSWAGHFTFTGSNALSTGTGAVTMTATRQVTVSASTLTVSGIISGATYGLTKLGVGTMTLSGVNTYTGATTVTAGTLAMGVNNAIPVGGGGVVLNGGTLSTGNFTAGSTTTDLGTLTLSENSTLALGSTGTLYFSSSTGVSWTAAKTLTITGFVSSATNTAGTAGRLFVDYRSGNDCSNCGLTGSSGTNQLGLISFNTATINGVAGTYGAMQMVSGEIVAVSVTATITLASNTVNAASNCASSTKVPIQSFSLAITNGSGNLTNVGFTTTGNYAETDITNYKLWYGTDNDLNHLNTTLITTLNSLGDAGTRAFTAFTSPTLSSGSTYYFWITMDVASNPTNNVTLGVNAITTTNLTSTSTKAGSDTDTGGTQTLKAVPTTSNAGTDQISTATCGVTQTTLDGNNPTVGIGNWSIFSGTGGILTDATLRNTTFTGALGSTYVLRWTVSNTSCNSSTDDVTITFNSPMSTTPANGDYVWRGTDNTWSTASNWLSHNGTAYSVAGSAPTSSSRVIITNANSCPSSQPILGSNVSVGSLIIESGATLNQSTYTISINGGFTNNGTFTAGTGTTTFTGTGAVSGVNTFYNLVMNGTGITTTLSDNQTITNGLTLTNGKLSIASNKTLSLGSTSGDIILTGGSSSSYIVTTDNTSAIKRFINSKNDQGYVFPMGDATIYSPMTFTLNNATGSISNAYLTTYVVDGYVPGFNQSQYTTKISRYWSVEPSGMTSPNYDISYTYDDTDISGTETALLPIKKSGTTWYKPNNALNITTGTKEGTGSVNDATNTLTWTGLSTFSFDTGTGDEAQPLPIHLLYFTAKPEAKKVRLDWATASETNNDYFTVERSQDGEHFSELFKKPGAGISTTNLYYFGYDNKPITGTSYYRLKQTDFDGKYEYSDIESVSLQGTSDFEGLKVYPNPSDDNRVHVEFSGEQKKEVTCILHDAVGKEIAVNVFEADKGLNSFTLEYPEVATGMYLLEIRSSDGNVQQIQLKLGK